MELGDIVGIVVMIIAIVLGAILFLFDWRSGSVNQYLNEKK